MTNWTQRLEVWHDFYLLMGGAAATLMGLTFVAVTLGPKIIAEQMPTAVRAFITPTVALFATVLLISIIMLIPHAPLLTAIALAVLGLIGAFYMPVTGAHRQWRAFELGIDDLLWYLAWPFAGYLLTLASAFGMLRGYLWAPYAVAASAVLFLVVAIRNAWDVVVTIAKQTQQ
jgi:hypothetical protein